MNQSATPAIVCLAHLPWDFVWQRPQQLLSRLAEQVPVLYINEPEILPAGSDKAQVVQVAATGGVSAWQPGIPDNEPEMSEWRELYWQMVRLLLLEHDLVQDVGGRLEARRPLILWFYTPTPYYLAGMIPASLIVYDVMDELSNFKGAGADLRQREACLLEQADLVFAGGRSLYEARQGRHPNLHLFPSGVEPDHFATTNDPQTPVSPLVEEIPGPRLGYIGVIDERLDLVLLDRLATQQPDWSIVMVGPVRKIEEEALPQRSNIHYLGQQPYEDLPQFLKGFDVCLMPFALNQATRSISPTKTLEYMATHKPIVSTAVPDVVASWNDVVWISGAASFADTIREALAETDEARTARLAREQGHLECSTWQAIAGEMQQLIETELKPVLDRQRNGQGPAKERV